MKPPRASGGTSAPTTRRTSGWWTRAPQRASLAVFLVAALAVPWVAGSFALDLANQVLLAAIGAVALMLLTG